jgi:hypothetical protein
MFDEEDEQYVPNQKDQASPFFISDGNSDSPQSPRLRRFPPMDGEIRFLDQGKRVVRSE